MRKPRVYVAGPITSSGSLHENLCNGIKVGEELRVIGFHPFIPHLYDFAQVVVGKGINWYEMLEMDENWISACDLLVALPGDSKGKEREIAFCSKLYIPVIRLSHNTVYDPDGLPEKPLADFLTKWKDIYGTAGIRSAVSR